MACAETGISYIYFILQIHTFLADMVISANAFIIFLGGFETTSSTLAFLFLELAAHSDIQRKLRREVVQVMQKYNGQVSYEMLQELDYMEMVIQGLFSSIFLHEQIQKLLAYTD